MQADEDVFRLLMQIGFMASGMGCISEADAIFSGIEAMQPESEYPLIGKAVNRLNALDLKGAIQILTEQALQVNPESDLAKAFLAFTLKQCGFTANCRAVCLDVIGAARDGAAVAIVEALLKELDEGRRSCHGQVFVGDPV